MVVFFSEATSFPVYRGSILAAGKQVNTAEQHTEFDTLD